MTPVLIKNGLIYDGSGEKPFFGDVLMREGRIARVGKDLPEAGAVIDATGKAVCPGFVDIHRHPDVKPFFCWMGDAELRQGITTTVAGNCGISMTPASREFALAQYAFDEPVLGKMCPHPVRTYPEYMAALDERPLPVNMASMIGTGSVRISLKGFSDAPFTEGELRRGRQIIAEALEAGAVGVSMGIMYLPECYGTAGEFAKLLSPLGERGGVLATHIRGEGDGLVDAVREVVEIARRVGCPLEISHFKSCGVANWRKRIFEAIDVIEQARGKGQDVTCDFYPYDGGSTALTTMIPPAYVGGDMASALARLGTEEGVEEFRRALSKTYAGWDNFAITLGWDRIIVSGVARESNRRFLGMTVTDAAKRFGFDDAAALAAFLMHDEDGRTAIINMSMCMDDVDAVAKLPYSSVISDAIYADTDTPHPRMFGAMPKMIREFVRERHVLTMENAIRKMTKQPALRMGLLGRGCIEPGACADVLVFDPAKFQDNATFENPAQLATGLDYAFVNGGCAVENDKVLRVNLGKNIRREGAL